MDYFFNWYAYDLNKIFCYNELRKWRNEIILIVAKQPCYRGLDQIYLAQPAHRLPLVSLAEFLISRSSVLFASRTCKPVRRLSFYYMFVLPSLKVSLKSIYCMYKS